MGEPICYCLELNGDDLAVQALLELGKTRQRSAFCTIQRKQVEEFRTTQFLANHVLWDGGKSQYKTTSIDKAALELQKYLRKDGLILTLRRCVVLISNLGNISTNGQLRGVLVV